MNTNRILNQGTTLTPFFSLIHVVVTIFFKQKQAYISQYASPFFLIHEPRGLSNKSRTWAPFWLNRALIGRGVQHEVIAQNIKILIIFFLMKIFVRGAFNCFQKYQYVLENKKDNVPEIDY